ncbi:MAG: class I SAM-dependent methyltransferase [Pseudomonadota bacterium]
MTDLAAARALVGAGRFDAALKLLAALPEGPGRAVVLAAAHVGRKEGAQALAALEGADPADPEALFHAGRAHLLASNAFAAVAAFERLRAGHPGFPGLAEALAGAYRRDARYADCVALAGGAPPSRQLAYEAAVSLWRLGEAEAALAAFDALLSAHPDHAASWVGSAAPALDLAGLDEAARRVGRALACAGANGKYWALLAVLHALGGRDAEAADIRRRHVDADPRRRPLADSVAALPRPGRVFGVSRALLRHAMAEARIPGLVLEFGVRRGTSLGHLAEVAGQEVHGFDSFEGLPEDWGRERAGVLTTGRQLPNVHPLARLHPGWFADTLPGFLAAHPGPARLVNVDSDIYASARTVLTHLAPRVVPGTVLVFDEMIGNRTWRDDEYRAWMEFVAATGIAWEVVALSPFTKQVAVRVMRVPQGSMGEGGREGVAAGC